MEYINISQNELTRLERTQGNHIKQCLGLGKTVHSTNILQALNVRKIVNNLSAKCLTFYNYVFSNETPATKLNRFLLSHYVTSGRLIPGIVLLSVTLSAMDIPLCLLFLINRANIHLVRLTVVLPKACRMYYIMRILSNRILKKNILVYILTKSF